MQPIIEILEERVSLVLSKIAGEPAPAVIKLAQNQKFGDYQINGVMGLAKKLKCNPRELAGRAVTLLDLSDMCQKPEIAGPGFINLRLKPEWLITRLTEALADDKRLGIDVVGDILKTVVDFSGPNLAKEMHVGHLRSTIIGDALARVMEFISGDDDKVVRQNHVGDWGLQFGMLAAYIRKTNPQAVDDPQGFRLADLEEFYRSAKQLFDNDEQFRQEAYKETVALHKHNADTVKAWECVVAESRSHCQAVYDRLNVILDKRHERGESCYSDKLGDVVKDLNDAEMIQESDGAQCVFLEGFKSKDNEPLPLIVQKSDGAYLYATTDLAAIRYRINELNARRIIYVTDSRQKLHFSMVFECARRASWAGDDVLLEHVPFGSVLGEDGKPFKTRSGENVKLSDLLTEAETRALAVVEQKNPDLSDDQKSQIADAVGIGAVKYADLSNNLVSDYVFDWDKMLAMEGNTAPYMQYAYARVQSIFRKGQIGESDLLGRADKMELTEPVELNLAKTLLRFGDAVTSVARELRPHILTSYLFDLAQTFNTFYAACPVLKSEDNVRDARLILCDLTAKTIKRGLELLGIKVIEQM